MRAAETRAPTDTTTITISRWKSDGSADDATFAITSKNSAPGGPALVDERRLYYTAKADSEDRLASKHPTVKPVDLMRWLVALVTPPNGTVLDPFAGTGTTGAAALLSGRNAILIEGEQEYIADIHNKIAYYSGQGKVEHHQGKFARGPKPRPLTEQWGTPRAQRE